MGKKLIEMVCTGNRGRSPVAELIARNRIIEIGASDVYDSISSGTNVAYTDKVMAGEIIPSQEMISAIISMGRANNVYTSEQLEEIDSSLRDGEQDDLIKYFIQTSQRLMDDEESYRAEVLTQFGIDGDVKPTRDQTIARPDTLIVLAMDKKNLQVINRIYQEERYSPIIDTLSNYATGVPDSQVLNAFGKGKDIYRDMVRQLIREVPIAVDKLVEEL